MTQVRLERLTRHFDQVAAVERLSLEIEPGQMVALLGPSGCGKTTTLRMIAGLLHPDSGDILFDGRSVLKIPSEKRGAVMVFQKHLLFPTMTIAQNVGFGLRVRRLRKQDIRARVAEMLDLVRLADTADRMPHELSGGQQQRIALARALIVQPNVLLLDEPLANLDANLRLEMRELITRVHQETGVTTIFVTHDQEEAVMMADRIALMFAGKLQQYDPPQAFYEQPGTPEIARFFRNDNFLDGIKRGDTVTTGVGSLRISQRESDTVPDGPVRLTVRPEEVILGKGENGVPATVRQSLYMGSFTRVKVDIGGREWTMHAPARCRLTPGEAVTVTLPVDKIWLFSQGEM